MQVVPVSGQLQLYLMEKTQCLQQYQWILVLKASSKIAIFFYLILHFCNFFPVYLAWLVAKLRLDKKQWKCFFVNFRVFVCLFKRPGSIPNDSISIWNASLSLKQENKHTKINKQTIFFFCLFNPKKIAKLQNHFEKNASVDDALNKIRIGNCGL